jgi:hypothetical protein
MEKKCQICDEKYNKTNKKIVKCQCDFICCRSCSKKYIENENQRPKCMSCKTEWNRNFMTDNFEKTYMNKDYKKLLENVLFDKEKALLPETQVHVKKDLKIENLKKQISEKNKEEKILYDLLKQIKQDKINIDLQINQLKNKDFKNEKHEFIRKCPNGECNGFLSTTLKCELCNKKACKDCRELKEKDHVCNPDILSNVKMLENDSKNCPKCSSMIHKIDGCNMMFCTMCKTAFDWKTLKIERGIIHNPHFFQWQREREQIIEEPLILCGEITNNFVRELDKRLKNNVNKDFINDLCRNIIHIRLVEIPNFQTNNLIENLDLRIEFMKNKIDVNIFKTKLQRRQKMIEKKMEIENILTMFVTCMTDILQRLCENIDLINPIIEEMYKLKEYVNNSLYDISKYYTCIQYEVDETFYFGSKKSIQLHFEFKENEKKERINREFRLAEENKKRKENENKLKEEEILKNKKKIEKKLKQKFENDKNIEIRRKQLECINQQLAS